MDMFVEEKSKEKKSLFKESTGHRGHSEEGQELR